MKIKHILLFLMAWVSSMSLAYAQQTVVASVSVMDEKGELLIGGIKNDQAEIKRRLCP